MIRLRITNPGSISGDYHNSKSDLCNGKRLNVLKIIMECKKSIIT